MTKRTEKPSTFEFTHYLTMHQHINKHKLKKSEYSFTRKVDKDGGWKWVLVVSLKKEKGEKENV